MKISTLYSYALRNNEHFQFQTEFKELCETFDLEILKIDSIFTEKYLPLYADLDEAIFKIIKNTITDSRIDTDMTRDSYYRGISDTVKAGLNHFDSTVVAAARRISIPFNTYGNVAQLPLNEETSAIYNLVQELRAYYFNELAILNLDQWIDELEAVNKLYEQLVKSGFEEDASKTELKVKQTRTEIDKIVRAIFTRIEALIEIGGEDAYTDFVRRLNLIINKYANILAQRQGIAAANRETSI